jgi:hypothetical protein
VNFHLREIQRDQATPLLAGRTEIGQNLAIDEKLQIVAMRSDGSKAALQVLALGARQSCPEFGLQVFPGAPLRGHR